MKDFHFKQFSITVEPEVFPITTDAVLLGSWVRMESGLNILDVGTGSGILSLMLAQKSAAGAQFYAVDSDLKSVQCAESNFKKSPWAASIHVIHLNANKLIMSSELSRFNNSFDLIVSNPPYFSESLESNSVAAKRSKHQREFNFSLLAEIARYFLNDFGKINIVIPLSKEVTLTTAMMEKYLYPSRLCRIRTRMNGMDKLCLTEYGKQPVITQIQNLILFEPNNKKTTAYRALTDAYYL